MRTLIKAFLFVTLCIGAAFIGSALGQQPLYQHECKSWDCRGHVINGCSLSSGSVGQSPIFDTCFDKEAHVCNLTGGTKYCWGQRLEDDIPCGAAFSHC